MAYDAGTKVDPIKQLEEIEKLVADLRAQLSTKEDYIQKLESTISNVNASCLQRPIQRKE